jgi:hypothetical protein
MRWRHRNISLAVTIGLVGRCYATSIFALLFLVCGSGIQATAQQAGRRAFEGQPIVDVAFDPAN